MPEAGGPRGVQGYFRPFGENSGSGTFMARIVFIVNMNASRFFSLPLVVGTFVFACFLALASGAAAGILTPQEQQIANYMSGSGQHRPFIQIDPILTKAARAKAADMAHRHYYSHTTPEGVGPNFLVRQAGYKLPASYNTAPAANNIESIDAGYGDAASTWNVWMGSPDHRHHLLAEDSFYVNQTSVGIGFASDPNSDWQYYWVVITAPPQPVASLTIGAPAVGAQVTDAQVMLSGTTGTVIPASRVEYRLENSAGVGDFQSATGVTAWSAVVTGLVPGPNVLRVRSLDASGNTQVEATRSVLYAVPADLTVEVTGTGIVSPAFAGTTTRDLGVTYAIIAAPGKGMIFQGWTGSLTSSSPILRFTMAQGMHLTASFIPNPFLAVKGPYFGMVSGDGSGRAVVSVTPTGSFTGTIRFAGATYVLRGQFDGTGHVTLTLPRRGLAPLTVALQLDLSGAGLTGSVTDGTITDTIQSNRVYDSIASGPYTKAGRYTIVLPPDAASTDATLPQGDGYAVLLIAKTGAATLSGTLPDGHSILFGSRMSAQNDLAIWIPLAPAGSALAGSLAITPTDVSDLQGTVRWTRAAMPTAAIHPAALDTTLPLVGSLFVRPAAGTPVFSVPSGADNSQLILGDGNLSAPVMQPATLTGANQLMVSSTQLSGLNATIYPTAGVFRGTFVHPVSHAVSVFRGVIFQKQDSAYGFFLGPNSSGYTSLSPAQ